MKRVLSVLLAVLFAISLTGFVSAAESTQPAGSTTEQMATPAPKAKPKHHKKHHNKAPKHTPAAMTAPEPPSGN